MEQPLDLYHIDETNLSLHRQYMQLAHTSDSIARGIQKQAELAQTTSRLIGDMADLVNQIGQVAHTVAGVSVKVAVAARIGRAAVGQSSQSIKHIQARTVQISQIVEAIDDAASEDASMRADGDAIEAAATGTGLASGTSRSLDEILRAADAAVSLAERITRLVAEVKRKSEGVAVAIGAVSAVVSETTAISVRL